MQYNYIYYKKIQNYKYCILKKFYFKNYIKKINVCTQIFIELTSLHVFSKIMFPVK